MSIKISVIIPTYKRYRLLLLCLNALRQQNFAKDEFEIIVVCDGPDAETFQHVEFFKEEFGCKNIHIENLSAKKGPAAARNYGVSKAKGLMLAFTDDDCKPKKDWLLSYWRAWNKNSWNEIAFTGKTLVPTKAPPTDYEKNISHLQTAEFITANCACTKNAFIKAGGFDEQFPIAWREDSDFHFKLIAKAVPIQKINEAVVIHPVRKATWGVSISDQKKAFYDVLLFKRHPYLFRRKIKSGPIINYYAIICFTVLTLLSLLARQRSASILFAVITALFISLFIVKRLKGTSKRPAHIFEMLVTSMIIPFLSVYWTLRGSLRYKKLLL